MLDNNKNINLDLGVYASSHVTDTFQADVVRDHHDIDLKLSDKIYNNINKLEHIKNQLININLSRNKVDLENLIDYFKHRLKQKPFDLDLTLSLGNCLEKLGQVNRAKRLPFQ